MALLLHVLMLVLLSGVSARVVRDFELECGQFFANGKSPTRFPGLHYEQICQTLNGVDYYATYYDTTNKIPVYSAYRFRGLKRCTRLDKWYNEPQLDDNNAGPNMALSETVKNPGQRQALNRDYEKSKYDRGHLAPVYQAETQSCADATFTLTNAAPQNPSFNRGVIPGTEKIGKNKDVNVPSHFWTAYCCLDQNNKCSYSGGVTGTNEMNTTIKTMNVTSLEDQLKNLYGKTFRLFIY